MKTQILEDVCVVLPGYHQVDSSNALSFGEELGEAISECKISILDLEEVEFIDSSGLGKIVSTLRNAREKQQSILICNPRPAVNVLFEMVRLSQIAEIYDTREEALQSLKKV